MGTIRYTLKDLQYYANLKGGVCLASAYVDMEGNIDWKCKAGHVFTRSFHYIKKGYWCQACIRAEFNQIRLSEIRQIAISRGGQCLSEEYENKNAKLKFSCKNSHKFEMSFSNFQKGQWCKACREEEHRARQYELLKRMVEEKGGKVISKAYIKQLTYLKFECEKGHLFKSRPLSIELGVWCDECKRNEFYLEIKKRIEAKGGRILTKKYTTARSKLMVECAYGHKRNADASDIRKEFSCTYCLREREKDKVHSFIVQWAKKKRGRLISKKYINGFTPLLFECEKGHRFKATPSSMKHQKSWCQKCYWERAKGQDK